MNKEWGADQGYSTMKTPTCLLLNPDNSFNSFGFEAQDTFAELEDLETRRYYYFERFKMILHCNEVRQLTFMYRPKSIRLVTCNILFRLTGISLNVLSPSPD